MLNKKLTGLEIRALALKYVNFLPDAAINRELGRELRRDGYERQIPLHFILSGALRKLKTGGLADFKEILNLGHSTIIETTQSFS